MNNDFNLKDEYMGELYKLLDLYLLKYFLKEEIYKTKGINKYKGLAITPDDVKIALNLNVIDTNTSDVISTTLKIKAQLENIRTLFSNKKTNSKLDEICNLFNLDYFEKMMILFGISSLIDQKYHKIYGYLNDNMTKKTATIGLFFSVLEVDDINKVKIIRKLRGNNNFTKFILDYNFGKIDIPLYDKEIKITSRIENYIFNVNEIDYSIKHSSEIFYFNDDIDIYIGDKVVIEETLKSISNYYYSNNSITKPLYIKITGILGSGRKHLAKYISQKLERNLLIVDFLGFNQNEDFYEIINSIIREAVLKEAIIAIENYNLISEKKYMKNISVDKFFSNLELFSEPIFLITSSINDIKNKRMENTIVNVNLDYPNSENKILLWKYYSSKFKVNNVNAQELSNKFNITPLQIKNTIIEFRNKSIIQENKNISIYDATYRQIENMLVDLAVKIKCFYTWKDIVLPNDTIEILTDVCNQVKFKNKVLKEWGFGDKIPYGKGVSLICSGPPGTGKTMSAQVIASELNLELYKIDLSKIISKYIGETEKNLNKLFDEAKNSSSILFFDESDAIFGKRTSVKDSKDRYSNIEVSYLLQKIEEYEGITILATNYLKNIDKAFLRRINYIISFPFPDEKARKQIWKKTFPDKSKKSDDIDFEFLANTFEISGGNIKNIVLNSAYLAAAENSSISMKHIIRSTKYELQKIDKLLLKEDLKEYSYLLDK
ncbi:ATP-binding protein [Helicovermis profundi]|uniref:ATP-binding protein n=2 Tax=Helicovermis profundi TaxID=3065157 RepID=A0AAU9EAU4_9FIRM|nr:ATP-binding protein [Clostridia bacterium S502]